MAEKKTALAVIAEKLTHHHLKNDLSPKELHSLKDKVKKALAAHHEEDRSKTPPSKMDSHHFEKWSKEQIAKGMHEDIHR
jgi:hypothetical protein